MRIEAGNRPARRGAIGSNVGPVRAFPFGPFLPVIARFLPGRVATILGGFVARNFPAGSPAEA